MKHFYGRPYELKILGVEEHFNNSWKQRIRLMEPTHSSTIIDVNHMILNFFYAQILLLRVRKGLSYNV